MLVPSISRGNWFLTSSGVWVKNSWDYEIRFVFLKAQVQLQRLDLQRYSVCRGFWGTWIPRSKSSSDLRHCSKEYTASIFYLFCKLDSVRVTQINKRNRHCFRPPAPITFVGGPTIDLPRLIRPLYDKSKPSNILLICDLMVLPNDFIYFAIFWMKQNQDPQYFTPLLFSYIFHPLSYICTISFDVMWFLRRILFSASLSQNTNQRILFYAANSL